MLLLITKFYQVGPLNSFCNYLILNQISSLIILEARVHNNEVLAILINFDKIYIPHIFHAIFIRRTKCSSLSTEAETPAQQSSHSQQVRTPFLSASPKFTKNSSKTQFSLICPFLTFGCNLVLQTFLLIQQTLLHIINCDASITCLIESLKCLIYYCFSSWIQLTLYSNIILLQLQQGTHQNQQFRFYLYPQRQIESNLNNQYIHFIPGQLNTIFSQAYLQFIFIQFSVSIVGIKASKTYSQTSYCLCSPCIQGVSNSFQYQLQLFCCYIYLLPPIIVYSQIKLINKILTIISCISHVLQIYITYLLRKKFCILFIHQFFND
ncbi:hypothetical protein FGO68_gene15503 [Halteria grandinella]|uniref:Uncharacterized protein n=1 Tax=Halteria grandinella TaxID=5974 RepID=A0A8J8NI66_HALGN|nr:hypothetical protein FGO68_gene15503 [Halteria grandinella]